MGNSQSTKKLRGKFSLPGSSSNYARLSSSPPRQPLLDHDSLNTCDCFEQHETKLKDMRRRNTDNEHKVAEVQRNIQYLESLQLSHSTAMEGRIRENAATVKKVIELENKIESLHHLENHLVSKNAALKKSIEENTASKKKVTELEEKIKYLELQISKNSAVESNIKELQAKSTGLALMSLSRNNTNGMELAKEVDEPEYVQHIMGIMLMLIFIVSISIGMQF